MCTRASVCTSARAQALPCACGEAQGPRQTNKQINKRPRRKARLGRTEGKARAAGRNPHPRSLGVRVVVAPEQVAGLHARHRRVQVEGRPFAQDAPRGARSQRPSSLRHTCQLAGRKLLQSLPRRARFLRLSCTSQRASRHGTRAAARSVVGGAGAAHGRDGAAVARRLCPSLRGLRNMGTAGTDFHLRMLVTPKGY